MLLYFYIIMLDWMIREHYFINIFTINLKPWRQHFYSGFPRFLKVLKSTGISDILVLKSAWMKFEIKFVYDFVSTTVIFQWPHLNITSIEFNLLLNGLNFRKLLWHFYCEQWRLILKINSALKVLRSAWIWCEVVTPYLEH